MEQYLKMADVFVHDSVEELEQHIYAGYMSKHCSEYAAHAINSHDELVQMNQELLAALEEGRRAIGEHSAPYDCYATGPITGDPFRDLVQRPACSFIAMYDDVIAKAKGGAV